MSHRMTSLGPVKLGGRVPVVIDNGKPNCPCCGTAMTEVDPGVWQCAARARDARFGSP
jgi:hypothetical protein